MISADAVSTGSVTVAFWACAKPGKQRQETNPEQATDKRAFLENIESSQAASYLLLIIVFIHVLRLIVRLPGSVRQLRNANTTMHNSGWDGAP